MLVGGAVTWKSVLIISTSFIMAAEFNACYEASNHRIWMQNFITGLHVVDSIQRPLKLFCDNDSAVKFSNNNKSLRKSKFVALKFMVVKERVHSKKLSFTRIGTNSVIADPLTKALPPKRFLEHVAHMGVVSSI